MTQLAASSPVMKLTQPQRKKTLSNKAIIWPNGLVIQGRNRSTGDIATCLHYQWRKRPIGSCGCLVRRKDDVYQRHQAKGRSRPFNCVLTVTINSLVFNFYVELKECFTNCLTRLRVLLGLLFLFIPHKVWWVSKPLPRRREAGCWCWTEPNYNSQTWCW